MGRSNEPLYCPNCNKWSALSFTDLPEEKPVCSQCKQGYVKTHMNPEDFFTITEATDWDKNTILKSIELKQNDPIQFEIFLDSLRNKLAAKEEANKPKCPKCGSSNLTPVRKKWGLTTGF